MFCIQRLDFMRESSLIGIHIAENWGLTKPEKPPESRANGKLSWRESTFRMADNTTGIG
jgi:hypothetical protein